MLWQTIWSLHLKQSATGGEYWHDIQWHAVVAEGSQKWGGMEEQDSKGQGGGGVLGEAIS